MHPSDFSSAFIPIPEEPLLEIVELYGGARDGELMAAGPHTSAVLLETGEEFEYDPALTERRGFPVFRYLPKPALMFEI